jgi:hypothetical protein
MRAVWAFFILGVQALRLATFFAGALGEAGAAVLATTGDADFVAASATGDSDAAIDYCFAFGSGFGSGRHSRAFSYSV